MDNSAGRVGELVVGARTAEVSAERQEAFEELVRAFQDRVHSGCRVVDPRLRPPGYPEWFRIVVGGAGLISALLLLIPRVASLVGAIFATVMAGHHALHDVVLFHLGEGGLHMCLGWRH